MTDTKYRVFLEVQLEGPDRPWKRVATQLAAQMTGMTVGPPGMTVTKVWIDDVPEAEQ